MQNYHAIRSLSDDKTFGKGDVLVLFGELFQKGYANGLVDEAERRGMKIIRATVGRREKDGSLRPLTAEEAALQPQPFINIPLEAGFDYEPGASGKVIVEQLKDIKLSEWENAEMPESEWSVARTRGQERFLTSTRKYLAELEKHIPAKANVLFAHLMAGGVPRAKIIMPLMNRSLKGTGDRFLESKRFWDSSLGKLCAASFNEVSAETFAHLVNESRSLREKIQAGGNKVSYAAYGYHGTEVLVNGQYQWQTYTPYLQGWAKIKLENYSRQFSKDGIKTCVYNCPEILTNSSSIFQGVEIPLYPLLNALEKEGAGNPNVKGFIDNCMKLLKPGTKLSEIQATTSEFIQSATVKAHSVFEKWPQHNSKDQLEGMLSRSDALIDLHQDPKNLITFPLSEVVFESCGRVMIADAGKPEAPVSWINHDVIAKIHSKYL